MEVGNDILVTVISPCVTESELADDSSNEGARLAMKEHRLFAISPDAIAKAILCATQQQEDININEVIVRPTASPINVVEYMSNNVT